MPIIWDVKWKSPQYINLWCAKLQFHSSPSYSNFKVLLTFIFFEVISRTNTLGVDLKLIGASLQKNNVDIFHGFHVVKTPTIYKWTLAYPLSHITQITACHWCVVQNIHNYYIQDLRWLQNHEGQELLMLKVQHLCLWFHKEIVKDSESFVYNNLCK